MKPRAQQEQSPQPDMPHASSKRQADIVCVSNVPTLYRLHLFDALNREAQKRSARLHCAFMAPNFPGRKFHEDLPCSDVDSRIYRGWRWIRGRLVLHINPDLVWSLLRRPPDILIIGGWADFTSALILLLFPIFRRGTIVLAWVEANSRSIVHRSGPIASARTFLLGRSSAFVVPGSIAKRTVTDDYQLKGRKFLFLPNLVNELLFSDRVRNLRAKQHELRVGLGLSLSQKVLVCNARLEEPVKGLIRFLGHVKDLWTDDLVLLVAGSGPDASRTETWLKQNAMAGKVRLLGHLKTDALLYVLAIADAFVLPSMTDANPLAAVEAAWAALPLLLSSRCGNWPELVESGFNGWLFDPDNSAEVRAGFAEIIAKTPQELRDMGAYSENRARLLFSTQPAVRAFMDDLFSLLGDTAHEAEMREYP